MDLRSLIRDVPDFPQEGILFRDITPLLGDSDGLRLVLDEMTDLADKMNPECIVAIESRGFIFGAPLADRLRLPFVPIRKPGKLPSARMSIEYTLEYGENSLDIHEDAMPRGTRALVVDDLLATGGTALAAAKLVELVGGAVTGLAFAIELEALGGRRRLAGYTVSSLIRYA